MRKTISIGIILIISGLLLSACGADPAAEEYRSVRGFNTSQTVVFTKAEAELQTKDVELISEAEGPLVYTEFISKVNLKVYSKPDENSSVIGTITAGADIMGIELMSDNWSKISYNGRIAYIRPVDPLTLKNEPETESSSETEPVNAVGYNDNVRSDESALRA